MSKNMRKEWGTGLDTALGKRVQKYGMVYQVRRVLSTRMDMTSEFFLFLGWVCRVGGGEFSVEHFLLRSRIS